MSLPFLPASGSGANCKTTPRQLFSAPYFPSAGFVSMFPLALIRTNFPSRSNQNGAPRVTASEVNNNPKSLLIHPERVSGTDRIVPFSTLQPSGKPISLNSFDSFRPSKIHHSISYPHHSILSAPPIGPPRFLMQHCPRAAWQS
jgi:hypothetical protein